MRKCIILTATILWANIALADGPGFSIRRQHAVSIFTFTGASNLKNYALAFDHFGYFKKDSSNKGFYADHLRIIDQDPYILEIQEGGRRWEESDRDIYLSLIDTIAGITTDSVKYYAKDYNIRFTITGIDKGKLQYKTDSTRGVYQYSLLDYEDAQNTYKRNRLIFIACSVVGFLLLIGLFIRNTNKKSKIM